MNNKGNADEFIFYVFIAIYIGYVHFSFYALSSWDSDIKSGKKFKIKDAVYRCEKVQELDLK